MSAHPNCTHAHALALAHHTYTRTHVRTHVRTRTRANATRLLSTYLLLLLQGGRGTDAGCDTGGGAGHAATRRRGLRADLNGEPRTLTPPSRVIGEPCLWHHYGRLPRASSSRLHCAESCSGSSPENVLPAQSRCGLQRVIIVESIAPVCSYALVLTVHSRCSKRLAAKVDLTGGRRVYNRDDRRFKRTNELPQSRACEMYGLPSLFDPSIKVD